MEIEKRIEELERRLDLLEKAEHHHYNQWLIWAEEHAVKTEREWIRHQDAHLTVYENSRRNATAELEQIAHLKDV